MYLKFLNYIMIFSRKDALYFFQAKILMRIITILNNIVNELSQVNHMRRVGLIRLRLKKPFSAILGKIFHYSVILY